MSSSRSVRVVEPAGRTLPDNPDLTYLHIDQLNIRRNAEDGGTRPTIVAIEGRDGKVTKGNRLTIDGPCEIVFRPEAPLNGGTRVWIETSAPWQFHTDIPYTDSND